MTAKEFLNRGYHLEQRITAKIAQLNALRDLTQKCTAVISGMPGSKNASASRLEETVAKIVDCENDLTAIIDELVDTRKEIADSIDTVKSVDQRLVLEMRYLGYKSWEEIASAMFCTVRTVYRLHGKALRNIKIPANAEICQ